MSNPTPSATPSKPSETPPVTTERLSAPKRKRKPRKPAKPYPDFPLTAHPTGRWCKKIKGKLWYFGKWEDPDGALKLYLSQRDELHAGRKPRVEGYTVCDLCNDFWNAKKIKAGMGQLSEHSLRDYDETCNRLHAMFGKSRLAESLGPDDFMKMLASWKTWGPVSIANEINRVRVVFKWGFDSGKFERLPRYGPDFKRPSKKVLRLERARQGVRMFEAEELRKIVAAAKAPLRAMLLLGINAGLGNADCGRLPLASLDLDGGWLNYHREKTGIPRRAKLWPETVAAIREAIAQRPAAKDEANAGLVFLTSKGGSWYKETSDNPVSKETAKLLKALGVNGHRNFYALRHTFRTVAGESRDRDAVRSIMGHDDGSIDAHYIERIGDDRLQAVAEHVRAWLFATVS